MIIFELPIELGMHRVDPFTFDVVVDHPWLEVGSSYSCLRADLKDWLDKHCVGYRFYCGSKNYCIEFPNLQDLTAFKLVWA